MSRLASRLWTSLTALLMGAAAAPSCAPVGAGAPASQPAAPIRLRNVAPEAGLRFTWKGARRYPLTNLESFGAGCGFWDFDNDGWADILLVGDPQCAVYRNSRDGRFSDVTRETGMHKFSGPWKGCAVGDIDGDGWSDLVLTGYHRTLLLRNERGQRLTDVTQRSGILNEGWGASAGFADLDADGDLDLYLCNYVVHGPDARKYCELKPGIRSGCPPSAYYGDKGRLYRNDGDGRFTDVSQESGIIETEGKGLVVGFCDYDVDGRIDFYVGNDGTPADLFRNLGGMRFENVGLAAGIALNASNAALAAMSIDWGDMDHDGRFDSAVTAFADEPFALFRNTGTGFEDRSAPAAIAGPTLKPLGFGGRFVDLDNDGWLDLVFACGHVYDNADQLDPGTSYRQPTLVFRNTGDGRFQDISGEAGEDCRKPIVGRGLATADYDRDGRIDVLIVDYEGEPLLLRNETAADNQWLQVSLAQPGGNPLGYGAVVEAWTGGKTRVFQVSPVASYLSSSEPAVHIGLGRDAEVESLRVRWPGGGSTELKRPALTVRHTISRP